jgi:hypothetical protein
VRRPMSALQKIRAEEIGSTTPGGEAAGIHVQAQMKLLTAVEKMKISQEQCAVQQQVISIQRKFMEVTQRL